MKYFYRPVHLGDLKAVYFVLDGKEITIERFELSVNMIRSFDSSLDRFKDYKEIYDGHEFHDLVAKNASKDSIDKFQKEYNQTYKTQDECRNVKHDLKE